MEKKLSRGSSRPSGSRKKEEARGNDATMAALKRKADGCIWQIVASIGMGFSGIIYFLSLPAQNVPAAVLSAAAAGFAIAALFFRIRALMLESKLAKAMGSLYDAIDSIMGAIEKIEEKAAKGSSPARKKRTAKSTRIIVEED